MTLAEFVTLAKEVILSGAAIVGIVVAIKGLGTWQRQLKGQSEYDLSRRILVSLFKYRDAIDGVRHPMMWAHEMPKPPASEVETMSSEKVHFYGISKAYQARWDKVHNVRTSLYADQLEAEALWGSESKRLFKAVFDLEHELLVSIRRYIELMNPDTSEATKAAIAKIDQKRRDIMYDNLSDDDDFKRDLRTAIENIERYLKPKLARQ